MKEPSWFFLFCPIFFLFFPVFSWFSVSFPDFWQFFRCQGGHSAPLTPQMDTKGMDICKDLLWFLFPNEHMYLCIVLFKHSKIWNFWTTKLKRFFKEGLRTKIGLYFSLFYHQKARKICILIRAVADENSSVFTYIFIFNSIEEFKLNQYRNFQLILPICFHLRYFMNSIIFRVSHWLLYCIFIEVDFEKLKMLEILIFLQSKSMWNVKLSMQSLPMSTLLMTQKSQLFFRKSWWMMLYLSSASLRHYTFNNVGLLILLLVLVIFL